MVYHIKMTARALLLYAIFVLLLEREKKYRFKRIFLLGSLVFAVSVSLDEKLLADACAWPEQYIFINREDHDNGRVN